MDLYLHSHTCVLMDSTGTVLLFFHLKFMLFSTSSHVSPYLETHTHTHTHTAEVFSPWPKCCLSLLGTVSDFVSFALSSKWQPLTGSFLCFRLFPRCQHGVVHTTQHDVEWGHSKRDGNSTANCSERSRRGGVWHHSHTGKSRYCRIYCSVTNLQVNSNCCT